MKFPLLRFNKQFVFVEALENETDMFSKGLGINEYVVKIHKHKYIQKVFLNIIN